jgi:hypothetical protein
MTSLYYIAWTSISNVVTVSSNGYSAIIIVKLIFALITMHFLFQKKMSLVAGDDGGDLS